MENIFYISLLLLIIISFLIIKIVFMKKSIREIRTNLKEILETDTNKLLTISTNDRDVIKLAEDLNEELKALREQRLEYETGNQEIKKVVTNISHDMRTPLTAISGYIDLIKEEKKSKNGNLKKEEEYLKIIERKTGDLISLTDNLFDFAKTVDLGDEIKKENCCINELLEEALANYYTIFKEKNITPEIKLCEEKIYKNVNRGTIIRVFENILSNVSKYSSGNFKVILEKEKIVFSNNANSLDATTVQKIFDRYFTVENAKKSNGLGLSIAKQLVELNGGKINAKYIKNNLIIEIKL